jgi:ABC-type transport system involved in multi-copper enzyme maturation permease subunit
MSTLTASPSRRAQQRVTPVRAAKSEWIKLISLRSSWITFAASVVAVVGLGVLISYVTNSHWAEMDPQERLRFNPVDRSLAGINLAQLAIGVLGVLVVTGEYSTGMIRSSLMSVPRRLPVLAGKAVVFASATFVLMLASAFVAFLLGQQVLGTHGTTLGAPHALRAVIGVALYLTVIALFAIGIGFIVRNTAGGIATLFGILLVAPGLGQLLPTSWQPHVLPYLPANAGAGVYSVRTDPGMLSTWTGFLVLCIWAAVALVVGAVLLRRRDA